MLSMKKRLKKKQQQQNKKKIGLNKTLNRNRFFNRALHPVPFSNASGHSLPGWAVHVGVGLKV